MLAARLAVAEDDIAGAIRQLEQATAATPDDAATWYEQFSIARFSDDENLRQQAGTALGRAFQLAPTNLVILLERLQAQAQARDASIVDTLAAGVPRWQQLAPGIESRVRVNINDLINDATMAATDEDWPSVQRNVMILKNVVTPEEATRSDRRNLERHVLEYVIDHLADTLMLEAAPPDASSAAITFSTATRGDGLPNIGAVTAIVSADFDLDTTIDVACLRADRVEIVRREGDRWEPLMSRDLDRPLQKMIALDLDDDVPTRTAAEQADTTAGHPRCHAADLDLVLYGDSGVLALQNVATDNLRSLQPIDLPTELANLQGTRSLVAGDLDMDGDLDLLVLTDTGLQLWGNRGDLQFDRALFSASGVPPETTFTAALTIDWDDDLDLDVILANPAGEISWLENLRHGEFRWRDLQTSVGAGVTSIVPIDREGAWDLLLAGAGGLHRLPSRPPISGHTNINEPRQILETQITGFQVADLNNDGPLDAIGITPSGLRVLTGRADTSFSEERQTDLPITGGELSGALDIADLDDDGLLDLVCGTDTDAQTLNNTTTGAGGWIDVSLLAQQVKGGDLSASGRVNHYGIGSVVELRSGVHRQRQIVRQPTLHFGLGDAPQADTVRVLWTNGVPENVISPEARTFICERQTLKGSCPYLYGWNGAEYAFITDLLWASPIGLVDPRGRIVPARPWEHLVIRPDQLVARDGRYELRLTEELWEAAYFDSVQLTAIDHPGEVEVVTNEKVGPPALAEHRLHTVGARRIPVSAVDQAGRDVLPLVREADEQYVKLFDHKHRQGWTEATTLELDFGDLSEAGQITLFLTGWIYPTDTTINVALSQNPELDGPAPLSLAVPDADGQWQTVLPFTGFPGGKTKTIAIDLSDVFLTDDFRIRLQTSLELYWDAAFLTVDAPQVPVQETELKLLRAELHSRGVSAAIEHHQHGPERYDYAQVLPSRWRPMAGHFTRLGDVLPLLREDDSQLVVMGSGDEVQLEFAAPPPPPDGWVRSFVIRNVGWDKDADLHTIYGQTVEPLPLLHMSAYPWPVEEAPDDPQYRAYLREYQTRRMVR